MTPFISTHERKEPRQAKNLRLLVATFFQTTTTTTTMVLVLPG
jgi:hypothetical protein